MNRPGSCGMNEQVSGGLTYLNAINGADSGDTRNMGWDRLIRPLGEGSFDTYELVRLLKDNGYNGKFGLQCFNIDQDCETALQKSIDTWRSYQARYKGAK